jgi:hypothetical protein
MPITPFLAGRSFEPETLKCMGEAFETVREKLGLKDRTDPFCQIVAEKVMAYTGPNDRDPIVIADRVLQSISGR